MRERFAFVTEEAINTKDLVIRRVGNSIHRIIKSLSGGLSVVCFVKTYPLDSDLSGGLRYPVGAWSINTKKINFINCKRF